MLVVVCVRQIFILTFSSVDKALTRDSQFVHTGQASCRAIPNTNWAGTSINTLFERTGRVRVYQSVNEPPVNQSDVYTPQVITRTYSIEASDWRWDQIWMAPGSSVVWNTTCAPSSARLYVFEGDQNLADWENDGMPPPPPPATAPRHTALALLLLQQPLLLRQALHCHRTSHCHTTTAALAPYNVTAPLRYYTATALPLPLLCRCYTA